MNNELLALASAVSICTHTSTSKICSNRRISSSFSIVGVTIHRTFSRRSTSKLNNSVGGHRRSSLVSWRAMQWRPHLRSMAKLYVWTARRVEEMLCRGVITLPGDGLLLLEIQDMLLQFLIRCARAILHDNPTPQSVPTAPLSCSMRNGRLLSTKSPRLHIECRSNAIFLACSLS